MKGMQDLVDYLVMPMLRERAPEIANALRKNFEVLITDTSELHEVPPYDLWCIVLERDNQAFCEVYINRSHLDKTWVETLRQVDAKELVEVILAEQLSKYNALMKKAVMWLLGGDQMGANLVNLLKQGNLKAAYDDDENLLFFQIKDGKEKPVNLQEFVSSL